MRYTRRNFITRGAVALGVFRAGAALAQAPAQQTAPATSPHAQPHLLEARAGVLKTGSKETPEIPVWGFDGLAPGPVLRLRRGQELFVRLKNSLTQATSIHWRGVHGPNAMDGVAGLSQAPVKPGETFDYRFTPPNAGTFIYHAHPHAHYAEQVHCGLSGVLIVEEDKPPEADVELMLTLADWRLAPDGTLARPLDDARDVTGPGRMGGFLTVNGAAVPVIHTLPPGARIRMRIANLCPARIAALTFDIVPPRIIAIDGQQCGAFDPVGRTIPAGPGARFDVLFDLPREEGKSLTVAMASWPLAGKKQQPPQNVMIIRTGGKVAEKRPAIDRLTDNPLLPDRIRLQDARRVELSLKLAASSGSRPIATINGKAAAGPLQEIKPIFSVPRGQPVTLGFQNRSQYPQVMRVHGHAFRLLHRFDDGWDPYWRDAVIVPPNALTRIAFVADNPGKWLVGSAIAAHADAGMRAWFLVD